MYVPATSFALLLREIMITQYASRSLHGLVVGSRYWFYQYAYLPAIDSVSPVVVTFVKYNYL